MMKFSSSYVNLLKCNFCTQIMSVCIPPVRTAFPVRADWHRRSRPAVVSRQWIIVLFQ